MPLSLSSLKEKLFSHSLLYPNETWILAISGGIDSMVLMDVTTRLSLEWGIRLVAAHVNYGLRGEESMEDAKLVQREAEKRNLIFELKEAPLKSSSPGNLQDRARRLRYQFFEQMAFRYHAQKVVTAHQAEDLVESFFLNVFRGAGPKGIQGMPFIRPLRKKKSILLVRPFLFFTRQEILTYAQKRKIFWREDRSNVKEEYLRNRIRHRILAEINHLAPHGVSKISEALLSLQAEERWIESWVETCLAQQATILKNQAGLSCNWLLQQPLSLRYRIYTQLFKVLTEGGCFSLPRHHLTAIDKMVSSQNKKAKITLSKGWAAQIEEKQLVFKLWKKIPDELTKRGFFS